MQSDLSSFARWRWRGSLRLCTCTVVVTTTEDRAGFIVQPRSAFIRRGDTAVLRCTPSSGYTVSRWLRDGRPLAARRRDHLIVVGGLLTVNSFARHADSHTDEGDYQCVASGPQGAFISRPASLRTAGITLLTRSWSFTYHCQIKGLFKVTSNRIHCKYVSILETVQNSDVVATDH